MAKPTILRSLNHPDASVCVDLFRRDDGGFGFQICRRDPEDPRGWYILGSHGTAEFDSQAEAWQAARHEAPWLPAT